MSNGQPEPIAAETTPTERPTGDLLAGKRATLAKASDFYRTKIRAGAWFELKKSGYKYYLYGRLRVGTVKKSEYISRV